MSGLVLFYIFVLTCVRVEVAGNLMAFFDDLPSKISDAWTYTWNNIVAAIKRPVEIKRLGKLGELKTTNTPLPPTIVISLGTEDQMENEYGRIRLNIRTPEPERHEEDIRRTFVNKDLTTSRFVPEIVKTTTAASKEGIKNPSISKLTIPHLKPPVWSSLEDWRKLQRPVYGGYDEGTGDIPDQSKHPTQIVSMLIATKQNWTMEHKDLKDINKVQLPVLLPPKDRYSDSWYSLTNDFKDNQKRRSIPLIPVLKDSMSAAETTTVPTTTEQYLKFKLNVHGSNINFNYKWYVNII